MSEANQSEGPERRGLLRLVTLGDASLQRVSREGEQEELLGSGKPFAVLVYLAATPGRSATRDHLIDLLWRNLDLDSARHALRQALWYLRNRLGAEVIRSRDDAVRLSVPMEFDRDRFMEAIEAEDYPRAVELYGGEFLPMFAAPGGADFEKWADMERYRLKTHFLRAAQILVRERLSEGAFEDAKAVAVRARDADPRNQNTWRLVLESHLAAGDQARARIEAHALRETLDEANLEPEPSLSDLLEAAEAGRQSRGGSEHTTRLKPELIGREQEFAAVLSTWRNARSGAGAHLHVSGAAGLGKSRLLAELDDRLKVMGVETIRLRAHPGERELDYALASDLAATLADLPGAEDISEGAARALVALNPGLTERYPVEPDESEGDEALRRRGIATEALLAAVTGREPLALLIDDLHWTDSSSRQVLVSLLERISDAAALIVTTARPVPERLRLEVQGTERLELAPLSEEELRRLLASLGSLPESEWADRFPNDLHRATDGSPLLALETLRLALDEGWLSLTRDRWECPEPERLRGELAEGRALQRRVERLPASEFETLLLLCVAGRPLAGPIFATALEVGSEETSGQLQRLEVAGLAARAADAWTIAHDEIAAAVVEGADEDELLAAHDSLGRAMAAEAEGEPKALLRAGRHLATADAHETHERVFARWVRAVRERGDRRGAQELAAEFSDASTSAERAQHLVRSLPTRLRWRLTGLRVAAVLLLVASMTIAGLYLRAEPPPSDATLYLFRPSPDGTVSGYELPLRHSDLGEGVAIDVRTAANPLPRLAELETRHPVLSDPSGQRWVYVRTVPDSGAWDVFLVDGDDPHRRLTRAAGDDVPYSWSPDGRFITLSTSRWGRYGWHDVAVLDVETGDVRRLSKGPADEHSPWWSPDGTRIAFRRIPSDAETRATGDAQWKLCWISVDGTAERCLDPPGSRFRLLGWHGADAVLVLIKDDDGRASLRRIELESGDVTVLDPDARKAVASPDGRWIASLRSRSGRPSRWHLFRTDRPRRSITLTGTGALGVSQITWGYATNGVGGLEKVEIEAPDTVPRGVPIGLRAEGFDRTGDPVPLAVLKWEVLGGARAEVDPDDGMLQPVGLGTVEVAASAGGWRADTARIVVVDPGAKTVFRESWDGELSERWVPFGVPRPELDRDSLLGSTLWVRGDGTFHSGVYSRSEFDAARGLGLEATVSTRRTAPASQLLNVALKAWENAEALKAWDHRTGNPPSRGATCSVRFPGGGGMHTSRLLSVRGGQVDVGRDLGSGSPYRLRVQVFPDRTCGVALDGDPVARVPLAEGALATNYRIVFAGKSVDTRMLVSDVEAWEGVPGEIDWSELEGGAVAAKR